MTTGRLTARYHPISPPEGCSLFRNEEYVRDYSCSNRKLRGYFMVACPRISQHPPLSVGSHDRYFSPSQLCLILAHLD